MRKTLLCLSVTLIFNLPCLAGVGTVRVANGEVTVIRGQGSAQKVKPGYEVEKNDIVSTGRGSVAIVHLTGIATHKIEENSSLKITDPRRKGFVELIAGSLFSFVKPSKTENINKQGQKTHYRVKTKAAVAGVRGTRFFTSYGGKKRPADIWVCVDKGEVEVIPLGIGTAQRVTAGQGVAVGAKGVSKPKALPWTKKLNWNMDPAKGSVKNTVDIEKAYGDPLEFDYD